MPKRGFYLGSLFGFVTEFANTAVLSLGVLFVMRNPSYPRVNRWRYAAAAET